MYLKLIKNGEFSVSYEETGNIGKRYRRQDAIGTFYCLTIDFETLQNNSITIRERDNTSQTRISIDNIEIYLLEKLRKFKKEFILN